nr:hypothetical protein [Butyrivibrio sp.]
MSEDRSQLSFHVLLLVLFTAFCILLDVIVLLSNWSGYIIFAGTILLGISWFIHFARLWDESKRLYFLVFCILVEIGLYATHGVAITDIPMI